MKEIVDTDVANLRRFWAWFACLFAFFALLFGGALVFPSSFFTRAAQEELHLLRSSSEFWHNRGVC